MDCRHPLSLLWADAWLPLLVYDLVESLVEENGEALAAICRCGDVAGVVVEYLTDVIRNVGHAWMIRPGVEAISASRKLVD